MKLLSMFIVFWNVENFFDPICSGTSKSEQEFSTEGARHWTWRRFHTKCDGIAKIMLMACDEYGRMPDVIGLAEVENKNVLTSLVGSTILSKYGYGIIHQDSPDHRGIDCALLYRKSSFHTISSKSCHLTDSTGRIIATRDILLMLGDSTAILVNHHPSKVGNSSGGGRLIAMKRLSALCDSLVSCGMTRIIAVGDFNEGPSAEADRIMSPLMTEQLPQDGCPGSIKFNGEWELIDRCWLSSGLKARVRVLDYPVLTTADKAFGGQKPLRTYSGPKYLGGISDHYPIGILVE